MFSEWRSKSKLFNIVCGELPIWSMSGRERQAYDLARAAYKAGVRAGIKQERARLHVIDEGKWKWKW